MPRLLLVLSLILTRPTLSHPPISDQLTIGSKVEHDIALFLRLTSLGLTAPLRWEATDWQLAGGIMLGTGVSSTLDDETWDTALRNRNRTNYHLERVFEAYGNGLSGIAFASVLYGSGLAFDNEWLRSTGIIMASAFAISAITQTTMKYTIGRARPYTGLGNHKFRPFVLSKHFASLPSGHTMNAFTISTVLAERIENAYASILLYTAAVLGGLSRIYSNNHWLSDVVFGAGLAFFASRSVVKWYNEEATNGSVGTRTSSPRISIARMDIYPSINSVTLVWRF